MSTDSTKGFDGGRMRHVYVVAGSRAQAEEWIENSGRDRRSVTVVHNGAANLIGKAVAPGAVVYVGTWLLRRDLAEVSNALQGAFARFQRKIGLDG